MFVELVDIVRERFRERGFTDILVVDGINAREQQTNFGSGSANRVAFVPSAQPIAFIPPTRIGEDEHERRQLLNAMFVFDVSVSGYDPSNPERDLAHRRRCFDIFEAVVQEVHRAYYGACEWTSARWEDARKDGRHGAELIATLVLNIPLFDRAWAEATPKAVIHSPKTPPQPEDEGGEP